MTFLRRYPATITAVLLVAAVVWWTLVYNHHKAENCHRAGGVWLSRDHKCVRGVEINP